MGQKIDFPSCAICHVPIEYPTDPCSLCGMFYHKSLYCSSIHAKMCRASSKKPFKDIIGSPHELIMPGSKDLFH